MGSKFKHDVRAYRPETTLVAGGWEPNGAAAVVESSIKGQGFSVARTGVGVFTVTLTETVLNEEAIAPTAQTGTAGAFTVDVGAYNPATRAFQVRTLVSGVLADVAANAGHRVGFSGVFRNSGALGR